MRNAIFCRNCSAFTAWIAAAAAAVELSATDRTLDILAQFAWLTTTAAPTNTAASTSGIRRISYG
jgi:hypothetical protein